MGVRLVLKLNQVDLLFDALTLLMKIVRSFRWRKFSSVGREGWYEKMKDGKKLKLGDAHVTSRHIKEVQGIPFFIKKNFRSSLKTLYFYFFTWYVLFLERHFILLSVLFCLLAGNKWLDTRILVWRETHSTLLFRTL